jgi:hypothetical protein
MRGQSSIIQTREQTLKTDEARFCSRPPKDKKRVVVCRSDYPVRSDFWAEQEADLNHAPLNPMFLATSDVHFHDLDLQTLAPEMMVCNAPSALQTKDSMVLSIPDLLAA